MLVFVRRSQASFVVPILLALAGCGGGSAATNLESGAAGAGGAGPTDGLDGAADAGTDAATSDGAALHPNTAPTNTAIAPGLYVTSASTAGSGACAGVLLATILAKIRAADPTLADIQTIYDPSTSTSDGSFIYPYARADGGFDAVFKRGLGDCVAGCTENDYRYYATDDACSPAEVGHFHAAWGSGTCLTVEGAPMWSHPPAPDPLTVCGQDDAAQDLRGTYRLHAVGTRAPCTATAAASSATDTTVTVIIAQTESDLGTGTVTFSGTGDSVVDGVPLPAQFQRRRFDATLDSTTTSTSCPRQSSVTARYDFELYQPGGIEMNRTGGDDCSSCKGSMSLTLTPAP
jgi:hypothetical protein